MLTNNLLIELYYSICHIYNTILWPEVQRLTNNSCPNFTDEECMAIYIFGIKKGIREKKAIHKFIKEYYNDWFPNLPNYQNFSRRINFLAPAFQLLNDVLSGESNDDLLMPFDLLDSMPIIVAGAKRSGSAKVAKGLCNKGYCASKGIYFYGVKLHVLAQKRYKTLPQIRMAEIEPASENDISVAKYQLNGRVYNLDIFADKMYVNKRWHEDLLLQNVIIRTPVKLKKGQIELSDDDKAFSKWVSSMRQPIESLFAWIDRKTGIQSASGVRSTDGLISFIFARLAALAFS